MKTSAWYQDKFLEGTIFLLFFVPPLVFMPGCLAGQWVFVEYTHTKLAAIMVLSWLFLVSFLLNRKTSAHLTGHVKRLLKEPIAIILGLFLSYASLSVVNSLVIEASLYELAQYWTLFLLFVTLSSLVHEGRYLKLVIGSICFSFAIVVIIGLIQLFMPIPWLIPISRKTYFSSTMGYKNPAALAITGQWFLLLYLGYSLKTADKKRFFTIVVILALVEAAFIAALQSRTSYFAFFVTLVFLFLGINVKAAYSSKKKKNRTILTLLAILLATTAIFITVINNYPKALGRFHMMVTYFKNPSKFLSSDRGTYLQNSIYMANQNILGVGIGNWRFAYPLYRKVNPRLCFNKHIQVQKAHCDYAQILGETGWPGFFLWLMLLGLLLLKGIKYSLKASGLVPIFFSAQFCAFLFLMMFDYVIQMPYHKFAFFTIITLLFAQTTRYNDYAS